MKFLPFINCLGATGINTGTALGLYDFSSGDSLIVWNQIYPTGYHYFVFSSGNQIYDPEDSPITDAGGSVLDDSSSSSTSFPYNDALPMIYNGVGSQTSGNLTGNYFYQISDIFTEDFSIILYLGYSGCNYTGTKNQLLIQTSSVSGAILGITPSNRLFLQTPDYAYTITKEIGFGDFAYFSVLGNRFVNFGLFSVADNIFYSKGYDEGSQIINVVDLTIGGALSYSTSLTGYSGKINEAYLFSGLLNNSFMGGCINCAFVTGYVTTSTPINYTETQITGSIWSGIYESGLISTTQVQTPYPLVGGGTGYVYVDSGISGLIQVGKVLIPLSEIISGTVYNSGISFGYNSTQAASGILFDYYFPQGFTSGDIVEIYTYSPFNTNVGFQPTNLQYPSSNSVVQIYGNGLAETSGVDFSVAFNNLIIGFDGNDILQYDIYPATYTMPYNTGYIQTGTTGSNFVNITGVSGMSLANFASDIYLNGQKMASGLNYSVQSQNILNVSGGVGGSAAFNGTYYINGTGVGGSLEYEASNNAGSITYNGSEWIYTAFSTLYTASGVPSSVPTGQWTETGFEFNGPIYTFFTNSSYISVSGNDLGDINDPSGDFLEIKFIPQYLGLIRTFVEFSGSGSYISGVSGFSSQVWINGLRQYKGLDYFQYPRCRTCSGNYVDPQFAFSLYNTATDSVGFFI